jgi:hypothetical protein
MNRQIENFLGYRRRNTSCFHIFFLSDYSQVNKAVETIATLPLANLRSSFLHWNFALSIITV